MKPIRITPTFEEFQAIVGDVRKQSLNAEAQGSVNFLEFMGLLGVGQAEASSVQKQHVNFATMQISFFRHKTKTPYYIPIFPQAEEAVKKLVRQEMRPTDPLFPVNLAKSKNVEAKAKTKDAKKSLAGACKRLGLPAYSQRALRRIVHYPLH